MNHKMIHFQHAGMELHSSGGCSNVEAALSLDKKLRHRTMWEDPLHTWHLWHQVTQMRSWGSRVQMAGLIFSVYNNRTASEYRWMDLTGSTSLFVLFRLGSHLSVVYAAFPLWSTHSCDLPLIFSNGCSSAAKARWLLHESKNLSRKSLFHETPMAISFVNMWIFLCVSASTITWHDYNTFTACARTSRCECALK